MSNVTYLAGRRHAETIGALRYMLEKAERGEVGGIAFVIDDLLTGRDIDGYTGSYRKNPGRIGQLLGALAMRLMHLQDRINGVGT